MLDHDDIAPMVSSADIKAEAIEDVQIAFRQLEFAIKLLSYCECGHINPSDLDLPHSVAVSYGSGNFSDAGSIERAASIGVLIAVGVSALILDQALERVGGKADPKATDDIGQLRTLIYMIRCAYAHRFADPRWKVCGAYRRTLNFDLYGTRILIDLTKFDGQPLDYMHHIGPYPDVLFLIRDKSLEVIAAEP